MTPGNDAELLDGRYRLGELLGVGGSASVFAAEDLTATGQGDQTCLVAVKMLHPHLCRDAATREAFFREARAAKPLRHPNVAAVHEFGLHEAGGVTMAWIALDLVDGPTVSDWVEANGPLQPASAAAVLDGVLAALEAAHALGIVHRDVTPQNVMLDGAGRAHRGEALTSAQVRLVDFGLAAATGYAALGSDVLLTEHEPAASGDAGPAAAATSERAPTGVVGNVNFMSPEHAQGKPVRAAGDLYQCGALLYFMLTGQPPYPRDVAALVLEAHVSAPPPVPSVLVPAARALDRIVTRAMTKTPARRYRTAAEFRTVLADAISRDTSRLSATDATAIAIGPDSPTAVTKMLAPGGAGNLDYLTPLEPAADHETTQSAFVGSAGGVVTMLSVAAVMGLAIWGAISATAGPGMSEPTSPGYVTSPTATAIPPHAPTAAPTVPSTVPPTATPTVPEQVLMPTLFGTLTDAETTLRAAGLTLGTITRIESAEVADRVLSQYPTAGEPLPASSTVDVTVASGTNTVPQVGGISAAAATALLQSAGFAATMIPVDGPVTATVTGTQPGAGAVLRVGLTVTLLLSTPAPSPDPEPTSTGPPAVPPGRQESL
ncbi:serine/threonine-protein kinase [Cryobacterium sp. TMT1-3]|uniref:protein kinase domain-containing protein n=1 Tax=Cryobacterium sp. TMT1-3 TaxID=1259237 RepID=UPI00106D9E98|nr:PASTA domain-containing protein [Cryobacterium sp. TMT1-3]TFC27361.1 serine/threonine-protein kinase [Cryobacterium sp. TMT1-3]